MPSPRLLRALAPLVALALVLGACGGDGGGGEQVRWIEGTAPPSLMAQYGLTPQAPAAGQAMPTPPPASVPTQAAQQPTQPATQPTQPATPPTATATATTAPQPGGDVRLTADQLQQYQPNELGQIPILEYHAIVTNTDEEAQFARTADDFREDLQWLYDHDFALTRVEDIVTNRIAVPAGKHPVALTFDDSYASQFRFIEGSDGTRTIDPESAVGIIEAFAAEHPDFGRTAFFATLPKACFDWTATAAEPDQTPLCGDKLAWLLDNGYEVGNHTLDHKSLYDVSDDVFTTQIGGAIGALQAMEPRVQANIIAMTFGDYPDADSHQNQRDWLRDGFTYDGREVKLIGCLMVGANPTVPPASTEWDPVFIPRIQAWDDDARAGNAALKDAQSLIDWFAIFRDDPGRLYTSDGNPNIITVPNDLPATMDGTLNADAIQAAGLELIRY